MSKIRLPLAYLTPSTSDNSIVCLSFKVLYILPLTTSFVYISIKSIKNAHCYIILIPTGMIWDWTHTLTPEVITSSQTLYSKSLSIISWGFLCKPIIALLVGAKTVNLEEGLDNDFSYRCYQYKYQTSKTIQLTTSATSLT